HELLHQRRRVAEVEHPGASGPPRDQQPDRMLEDDFRNALELHWIGGGILLHARAAIALDQALDGVEQIRPDRLRTEIAAPDPAADRVHQEQRDGGDDQEAGKIVDFLWPQLDEEEIETPVGKVDQHRLIGRAEAAIPAYEGQEI